MGKYEKLFLKVLSGTSDSNLKFSEVLVLLRRLEFEERIKGSHHIFYKENLQEIINIQDDKGKAKAYQIKQIRQIIIDNAIDFK